MENTSPFFGLATCNTHAIAGRGGCVALVDPGPAIGPHMARVEAAMRRDGLRLENCEKIFISHQHPDHSWGAPPLARKTGADIVCSEPDLPAVINPGRLWYDEAESLGGLNENVLPVAAEVLATCGVFFFGPDSAPPFPPVIARDGGAFNIGGTDVRILSTPGHRPGEIALHLPEQNAIVAGDIINSRRGDFPSINFPLSDLNSAQASLEKFRALNPEHISTGHEHFAQGRAKIQRWLGDAIARCEKLRAKAQRAISMKPDISLSNLGLALARCNKELPLYELRAIAYVTLKSFPLGQEWLDEKRSKNRTRPQKSI